MPQTNNLPKTYNPKTKSPVITTGVPNGPVVSRLELRTFIQDKDLTNLYLLALEHMQNTDQDDLSSWYQLAAIHGRPFHPYDNVGEEGQFGGYCTHSSILFPTWHRPYLALWEQFLSERAFIIAGEYKDPADRKRYTAAAQRFRIPYWDWALETTLPDIVSTKEDVTVYSPTGTRSIKNPLSGYDFQPMPEDFGDNQTQGTAAEKEAAEKLWESWHSTKRHPTSKDKDGKTQPDKMQEALAHNRFTLRDRSYLLLTQITDYVAFSHDKLLEKTMDVGSYDSIESIHNMVHGVAGDEGHMAVVDYAAFDPAFILHHANIDRLFAIWQALNPKSWIPATGNTTKTDTFTRKAGEVEHDTTLLKPFRRPGHDQFWDSNGVRNTRDLNYTYPELEEKSISLRSQIARLYGRESGVLEGALTIDQPQAPKATAADAAPPSDSRFKFGESSSPDWHDDDDAENDLVHYHEWMVNIAVEKYAVGVGFFVHIFIGDFHPEAKHWGTDRNLVGSHYVFASDIENTGCANCHATQEKKQLVTGTIPLRRFLDATLGKGDHEEKEIKDHLKRHLHWRISRDGVEVPRETVPSLDVTVWSATVADEEVSKK